GASNFGSSAPASIRVARPACRWIRCRWACRLTSKRRSRRARPRYVSARRFSALARKRRHDDVTQRSTVFIGGGNMATALIGGRIAAGAKASDFGIVEPLSSQRDALRARFWGILVSAKTRAEVLRGTV